jgi:serine/threonine protein kinase
MSRILSRFVRLNQVQASYHDYVCYLAYEKDTGLQVFWYEFINDKLSEEEQETYFERLQQAKQISSPNVLNILDVEMQGTPPRFVVVTEAAQAPSLEEYIVSAKPSTRSVVKWFKLLASAVRAVHDSHLDIAHGALTPHCVFIKPSSGSVKLRLPLTYLSGRKVPPSSLDMDCFRSPERLSGIIAKSNDIWALGMILLQLLVLEAPYSELQTPQELFTAVLRSQMPACLDRLTDGKWKDLIVKCLQPQDFRFTIHDVLNHPVLKEFNSSLGVTSSLSGSSSDIEMLVSTDQASFLGSIEDII